MVVDGNAKVGEAKVFQTKLEFEQQKEIEKLKDIITDGFEVMKYADELKVNERQNGLYKNYCEHAIEIKRERNRKSNTRS